MSAERQAKSLKVLAIAGSPRRGGNTDRLLDQAAAGAARQGAQVKQIVLSDLDIAPCLHCDGCIQTGGICVIEDDMQWIHNDLREYDRFILASPIFFMGITAQAKAMIDRCQALWARKYILKKPPLGDRRPRKGLFVSVGGMKLANLFEPSLAVVKAFFKVIDVEYAGELLFPGIDQKGAIKDHPTALKQAFAAGQGLVTE
jgi:NAD(P)H-dependent FMN reductase